MDETIGQETYRLYYRYIIHNIRKEYFFKVIVESFKGKAWDPLLNTSSREPSRSS